MDNLEVLRGMNSETVDLIATDPPFNKKRNRAGTSGQYEDAWRWVDHPTMQGKHPDQWLWQPVHKEWLDEIKDANLALFDVIEATRKTQDDDTAAFLCFLSVRLLEMKRVLKPTGSIYLHCDHSANAYIRMCMDAIFGAKNFRNEIVWWYKNASRGKKQFARAHDNIFWYSRSSKYTFNRDDVLVPFESGMTEWRYTRGGQSGKEMPKGKTPDDVIELPSLNTMSKERTGSPDQKPLELYERIIKASSNHGDLVLDPFAGCATTPIAARDLGRRWVGIDRRKDARLHVVCRMADMKKADVDKIRNLPHLESWLDSQLAKYDAHYKTEPPIRTDKGDNAAPYLGPVYSAKRRTVFTHREMHDMLIDQFGKRCWGCSFDGSIYGKRGRLYLELDHVNPKASGGHDELDNRALLCGPCNREKSDKQTLSELRRKAMGTAAARKHPIDLKVAGTWCRDRIMDEIRKNPKLAI